MPKYNNTYENNTHAAHAAWQNFIENRREETGRAIAEDPGFKKLLDEFQGTIDTLTLQARIQVRARTAAPGDGVNVQPVDLVNVQP